MHFSPWEISPINQHKTSQFALWLSSVHKVRSFRPVKSLFLQAGQIQYSVVMDQEQPKIHLLCSQVHCAERLRRLVKRWQKAIACSEKTVYCYRTLQYVGNSMWWEKNIPKNSIAEWKINCGILNLELQKHLLLPARNCTTIWKLL